MLSVPAPFFRFLYSPCRMKEAYEITLLSVLSKC
jgi:hypothetical protein